MNKSYESPIVFPVIVPTSSELRSYNFYIVKRGTSIVLVDTGTSTESSWCRLMEVLNQNQLRIYDINKIILTHSHADHIGLVNRIQSMVKIPVYAHEKAIPRLRRDTAFLQKRIAFFETLYAEMGDEQSGLKQVEKLKKAMKENTGQKIDVAIRTIKEGDDIAGFQVIELPGHADDHIALYDRQIGLLFAGDHLLFHLSSNALIEPDQNGQVIASLQQYEASLKKLRNFSLSVVYPGHGPFIDSPHTVIESRLKRIEQKGVKIKQLIDHCPCTAAQICRKLYTRKYDRLFPLVMSEVIGHLNRLEGLGIITREKRDGKWYFTCMTS